MTKDHLTDFFPGWPWKQLSCRKIVVHLMEYPWISLHCAPDHNAITSAFFHQRLRFLWRIYISVSNDGNRNCFFDSADRIPVCLSGIVLLTGASMNGHCCCTRIFYDFCNLYRKWLILDRNRRKFRFCVHLDTCMDKAKFGKIMPVQGPGGQAEKSAPRHRMTPFASRTV